MPTFKKLTHTRATIGAIVLFLQVIAPLQAFNRKALEDTLTVYANEIAKVGRVRITSINQRNGQTRIYTNKNLSYLPLYPEQVAHITAVVKAYAAPYSKQCTLHIYSDGRELTDLIPDRMRPAKERKFRYILPPCAYPLITETSKQWEAPNGLEGIHIAIYGSHGIYFNQKSEQWTFQRPRLLTTVEDLYTSAYTIPFIAPMLENAGAIVLYPRERDIQTEEIIVDDSDIAPTEEWTTADSYGWGRPTHPLLEKENPFRMGSYRQSKAQTKPTALRYIPQITKTGKYAVYVSYKSLPESSEQAQYEIIHNGQKTNITVNQQMGGGTWIYAGTYHFTPNDTAGNQVRVLNRGKEGTIITSDAIRFGGGYGSVARYRQEDCIASIPSDKAGKNSQGTDSLQLLHQAALSLLNRDIAQTSGYPRYSEGARYWLQYAGIPDSVYNYTQSQNDYIDDYTSRGRWANWLAGGSAVYPEGEGLGIPIHMGLALHSDAGIAGGDTIIGTLAIYRDCDDNKNTTYPTGAGRLVARNYADFIQSQIVSDLRATIAPEWNRRSLMNASYAEARNPLMPFLLLEILSHQNFADMRYGLDPQFRFIVSRAIYKGMLRFLHSQYGTPFIVQPLPVHNFAIQFTDKRKLSLTWEATTDTLEPTAVPDQYIVYTRKEGNDWDNGTIVKEYPFIFTPENNTHYDFQVVAVNKGGRSFPSETLSARIDAQEKGRILIINGFTRTDAPESFGVDATYCGLNPLSQSVPYGTEICYTGAQYEFDRTKPWINEHNNGFGQSFSNYDHSTFIGNTFDYPSLHGRVLAQMGYSYVSASASSINTISEDFQIVDIIMGKQKTRCKGTSTKHLEGKTFSPALRKALTDYTNQGGNILVSGSYIASDLSNSKEEQEFLHKTLHCQYLTSHATRSGRIRPRQSFGNSEYTLQITPDQEILHCENAEGISPYDKETRVVLSYYDGNTPAAIATEGKNKVFVAAFPLESLHEFQTIYTNCINWFNINEKEKSSSL